MGQVFPIFLLTNVAGAKWHKAVKLGKMEAETADQLYETLLPLFLKKAYNLPHVKKKATNK
jgi:hypothetical protein